MSLVLTVNTTEDRDRFAANISDMAGELLFCKRNTNNVGFSAASAAVGSMRLRVPIQDIIEVKSISTEDNPLPIDDCHGLVVSTFAKQYVIIVRGLSQRDDWIVTIRKQQQQQKMCVHSCHDNSSTRSDKTNSFGIPFNDNNCLEDIDPSFSTTVIADVVSTDSKDTARNKLSRISSWKVQNSNYHKPSNSSKVSNNFMSATMAMAALVSYPTDWLLGDKMILNGRNYTRHNIHNTNNSSLIVKSNSVAESSCRLFQLNEYSADLANLVSDPCGLVALLLDMVLQLSHYQQQHHKHDVDIEGSNSNSVEEDNNRFSFSSREDHDHDDDGVTAAENSDDVHSNHQTASLLKKKKQQKERDHHILWMRFLDGVSLLQAIDLTSLIGSHSNSSSCNNSTVVDRIKEEEEIATTTTTASTNKLACLFLNLYHVMLLHSFLVIGMPTNVYRWTTFFRNCSYEAFGDIFSLAELEHCIIRNGKKTCGFHTI